MSHNNECCKEDSCSTGHEHAHSCCCHCHDECHHEKSQSYSEKLLCLADEAWEEVLFEKIKEEIISKSGAHLTQLAQLVASTNHAKWKNKMAGKVACDDFSSKLMSLMGKCSENGK